MSDNTNVYDKTLQPGDTFEFVKSIYKPGDCQVGERGVITKRHDLPEAAYYKLIDRVGRGSAAYMCCMRRVDDSKSFIPEDWS